MNTEGFLVGKPDLHPSVMEAFAHIFERTRYIFRTLGLEESYFPGHFRVSS